MVTCWKKYTRRVTPSAVQQLVEIIWYDFFVVYVEIQFFFSFSWFSFRLMCFSIVRFLLWGKKTILMRKTSKESEAEEKKSSELTNPSRFASFYFEKLLPKVFRLTDVIRAVIMTDVKGKKPWRRRRRRRRRKPSINRHDFPWINRSSGMKSNLIWTAAGDPLAAADRSYVSAAVINEPRGADDEESLFNI